MTDEPLVSMDPRTWTAVLLASALSGRVHLVRANNGTQTGPGAPGDSSERVNQRDAEAAEASLRSPEGRVAMGCAGLLAMGFGVACIAVVLAALARY